MAFRLVPLDRVDAEDMIDDLAHAGAARRRSGASRPSTGTRWPTCSSGCPRAAEADADIVSADLNPLIVGDGRPVAVDALVEVGRDGLQASGQDSADRRSSGPCSSPGASSSPGPRPHPGKFGFVALHNILAGGYRGQGVRHQPARAAGARASDSVAVDRRPARRRGRPRVRVHAGAANPELLRACAAQGDPRRVPHLGRLRRGGGGGPPRRGRAGGAGRRARASSWPGPTARASCRRRANLCAQIVAPYPPAGRIGVASQSGNFVSTFLNYAVQTGVGVSRAVSAGNAAAVDRRRLPRLLRRRPDDHGGGPRLRRGRRRRPGASTSGSASVAERKPVVLVKGGATAGGQRAAASHTGSLASRRPRVRRRLPPGRRATRPPPSRRPSRPRPRSPPSRCPRGRTSSW